MITEAIFSSPTFSILLNLTSNFKRFKLPKKSFISNYVFRKCTNLFTNELLLLSGVQQYLHTLSKQDLLSLETKLSATIPLLKHFESVEISGLSREPIDQFGSVAAQLYRKSVTVSESIDSILNQNYEYEVATESGILDSWLSPEDEHWNNYLTHND